MSEASSVKCDACGKKAHMEEHWSYPGGWGKFRLCDSQDREVGGDLCPKCLDAAGRAFASIRKLPA